MNGEEALLVQALKTLRPKPTDKAGPSDKKNYSQEFSEVMALAVAEALRDRGLQGTRPSPPGESGLTGAERRMAGGIGDKKVDITWATEEAGLLLGVSVKSVNFRDGRSGNFQKNLTNRRGDMLFEAVTLHRRFPYAVLVGLFFFDYEADSDNTPQRRSTFRNAHTAFELFTGRQDPAGRDEQYERMYIGLHDANPFTPTIRFFLAGDPDTEITFPEILTDVMDLLEQRNSDSYSVIDGKLRRKSR